MYYRKRVNTIRDMIAKFTGITDESEQDAYLQAFEPNDKSLPDIAFENMEVVL